MTSPTPPAQSGMPPWARWTIIGCAGCFTLVILGVVGCSVLGYYFIGRNVKTMDMSDKPDLPLTASVRQLLPPRVDSFVRTKVTESSPTFGRMNLGPIWKGDYVSGSKHVELEVKPTAAARRSRSQPAPFGNPPQARGFNKGVHVTMKMGSEQVDMITWSKPNWSFTVQSPDLAALAFVKAYHPGQPSGTAHP